MSPGQSLVRSYRDDTLPIIVLRFRPRRLDPAHFRTTHTDTVGETVLVPWTRTCRKFYLGLFASTGDESTGLVAAARKNAELNPRPGHGHRGVRRGNVWLATIGTLIERLFQNTYAFVSLASPSAPARPLPFYHPLFFSFPSPPSLSSRSPLFAFLSSASPFSVRSTFPLRAVLRALPSFCFSPRIHPLGPLSSSFLFLPLPARSSFNHHIGHPLATCILSFSLFLSIFPLLCTTSVSPTSVFSLSASLHHGSASLSHRLLFRQCLYITTGWYAGAYIIRDLVCVHRYTVQRLQALDRCASRVLWHPSWGCIRGNISLYASLWTRAIRPATRVPRETRKNGRMYRRPAVSVRPDHVCTLCRRCITPAHACARALGQWRIFPPFFIVSFRIGHRWNMARSIFSGRLRRPLFPLLRWSLTGPCAAVYLAGVDLTRHVWYFVSADFFGFLCLWEDLFFFEGFGRFWGLIF